MDKLGDKILFLAQTYELNGYQFAKKIGWNSQDYSNTQKNKDTSLGYKKLQQLLKAYPQIRAEWLMRDEGDPFSEATEPKLKQRNVQIGTGNANVQQGGSDTGGVSVSAALSAKDAVIAAKDEVILLLKEKIARLEGG